MKDRLLSTLGICRKAGMLVMGFDAVAGAVGDGTISLVLLSGDLSPKTCKEMAFVAAKHNIDLCTAPITMEDIEHRLGKWCGVLGITDRGLAGTVKRTAASL